MALLPTDYTALDAIWIFSNEFKTITSKEIWSAHTSQPLGKPLHKHSGKMYMGSAGITLTDSETGAKTEIPRELFSSYAVGFDDLFTRLGYSRGLNPPLHFGIAEETVYIFSRREGESFYSGAEPSVIACIDPTNSALVRRTSLHGSIRAKLVYGTVFGASAGLIVTGVVLWLITGVLVTLIINLVIGLFLPTIFLFAGRTGRD